MAAPRKKKAEGEAKAPPKKRAPSKKKQALASATKAIELGANELGLDVSDASVKTLVDAVREAGGAPLGAYKDPLGGHGLLLASLPIDKVAPTSFQRDASPAHVTKLVRSIGKTGRFLDPVIAMREDDGRFLTPNGNHRLTAMRELGAKSIICLLVPERKVAYQILALNVEKAHNLRERATEVRRMLVDMAGWATGEEKDFELELEEPSLVTLGFAYEERGRLSGGAYASPLKKVDSWIAGTLADAVTERKRRAKLVIDLDDAVEEAVKKLKEKGLTSPYLKAFVVARVNPLRFMKGDPPPMDELFPQMTKRARGMNVDKIDPTDIARSGGAPDETD